MAACNDCGHSLAGAYAPHGCLVCGLCWLCCVCLGWLVWITRPNPWQRLMGWSQPLLVGNHVLVQPVMRFLADGRVLRARMRGDGLWLRT